MRNMILTNKPKKWNKIRGGAVSLKPRIKYDYRKTVPDPGRYDPNHKLTKPQGFSYIMDEKYKILTLNLLTGTDNVVGPGKYDIVYHSVDAISPVASIPVKWEHFLLYFILWIKALSNIFIWLIYYSLIINIYFIILYI